MMKRIVYQTLSNCMHFLIRWDFKPALRSEGGVWSSKMTVSIIVCLNGFYAGNQSDHYHFHQTNDPTGAWNFINYRATGTHNDRWTDFPWWPLTKWIIYYRQSDHPRWTLVRTGFRAKLWSGKWAWIKDMPATRSMRYITIPFILAAHRSEI